MRSWDCSQIENEEEEESWQEGKPNGRAVGVVGNHGKKKDGRKLFAAGYHLGEGGTQWKKWPQ